MKLVFVICLQISFLAIGTLCGPAPNLYAQKAESDNEKNKLLSSNQIVAAKTDEIKRKNSDDATIIEKKTLSQKLLHSQSDLRQYFTDKINEIYAALKEMEKATDITKTHTINVNQVPHFADPFYIGKFNRSYKLADIQYSNVRVYGLSNFKSYDISLDQANRKANITLVAEQLRVEGNYTLSNFLKTASGAFTVKLLDNVTYEERDLYCKFKDDVDVASADATIMYGKSQSNYENIGLLASIFEGVISNELTQEILYRVGREIGHKIRHVTTSKILQISTQTESTEINRLTAIFKSLMSEIRTSVKKSFTVPLPEIKIQIMDRNNFMNVSNITMSGLNEVHLKNDVKVDMRKDDISLNLEVEAGPLVISGQSDVIEDKNSTLVSLPIQVEYEIQDAFANITISSMLRNDDSSFEISELEVKVSNPNLKVKSDKMKVKEEDLQKLAQILKPKVESELYKFLKDFVNDTFRRHRATPLDAEFELNEKDFYA